MVIENRKLRKKTVTKHILKLSASSASVAPPLTATATKQLNNDKTSPLVLKHIGDGEIRSKMATTKKQLSPAPGPKAHRLIGNNKIELDFKDCIGLESSMCCRHPCPVPLKVF